MPRDDSLSDSKCWNGGQKWVNTFPKIILTHDHGVMELRACQHAEVFQGLGTGRDVDPRLPYRLAGVQHLGNAFIKCFFKYDINYNIKKYLGILFFKHRFFFKYLKAEKCFFK